MIGARPTLAQVQSTVGSEQWKAADEAAVQERGSAS